MRKHLPLRELVVAAGLFAINALVANYVLGVPASLAGPLIVYETDVQDGCIDGLDNETPPDGLIDCGDPDCVGIDPCVAPAPTLGAAGLVAGALTLLVVGGAALRSRRRDEQ